MVSCKPHPSYKEGRAPMPRPPRLLPLAFDCYAMKVSCRCPPQSANPRPGWLPSQGVLLYEITCVRRSLDLLFNILTSIIKLVARELTSVLHIVFFVSSLPTYPLAHWALVIGVGGYGLLRLRSTLFGSELGAEVLIKEKGKQN